METMLYQVEITNSSEDFIEDHDKANAAFLQELALYNITGTSRNSNCFGPIYEITGTMENLKAFLSVYCMEDKEQVEDILSEAVEV